MKIWMAPLWIAIAFLGLLTLSACGKKGPPTPAGPADEISYPRTYPAK